MDKNIESIIAAVNFVKDRMLTKNEGATSDDLRQLERHLDGRISSRSNGSITWTTRSISTSRQEKP